MRGGGAEKVLLYLLNHLDYSKFEVDLLLNIKHGVYLSELPKNVKIHYISLGSEFVPNNFIIQNINKLRNVILEKFYDLFPSILYKKLNKIFDVEVAFNQKLTKQLIQSPNKNSKKILWIHGNVKNDTSREDFANYAHLANQIIIVSQEAQNTAIEVNPEIKNKSFCLYNPIDGNEIVKLSNLTPSIPFPANPNRLPILIGIGTIYEVKGFDRLIEAHYLLKKQGILTQLYIVGKELKQEYLQSLKELVEKFQVEDTVFFLGFHRNPYPFLKNADIFVCSSHSEAFSLVIAEAIVLNKPVVSVNLTGPNELLNFGEFGILTENSTEGLTNGLKQMIIDKELRNSYIEKLPIQKGKFNPEVIMNKIEDILFN